MPLLPHVMQSVPPTHNINVAKGNYQSLGQERTAYGAQGVCCALKQRPSRASGIGSLKGAYRANILTIHGILIFVLGVSNFITANFFAKAPKNGKKFSAIFFCKLHFRGAIFG